MVLGLYILLALTHIVHIAVTGRTYLGYSSIGEMLVLAWGSPIARELDETSAGIKKVGTWKQIVSIQENENGRLLRLQIGCHRDTGHCPPRLGVKYERLDGASNTGKP